jgi:hypothetical protein
MIAVFQDLQDSKNASNGVSVSDERGLDALLAKLNYRAPFLFELNIDGGSKLLVGISPELGCVQYSAADGSPPYLMAVGDEAESGVVEFLAGNTPTPIPRRFCFSKSVLKQVIADFLRTGERSSAIAWEEI